MNKNKIILFLILIFASSALFFSSLSENKKGEKNFESREERNSGNNEGEQHYYTFPIPEKVSFADEKADLNNYYLRERFDRELLSFGYWHSQIFLMIKRANKYFPIIEPILESQGVPDDFKYLAVIESVLDPRAISSSNAAGIWQILPETAKDYGLEVNDDVDERYNIEKSTLFACDYLKKTYELTGSWLLAAASYNTGRARVLRQMETQQENSYFNLLFSEETNRYVFRILMAKQILENPQKYGFYLKKEDLYYMISYEVLNIDSAIDNLTDFAKKYGTTYQLLKDANPWLRSNKLSSKNRKVYYIKVPKKGAVNFNPEKIRVHNPNWVTNP